LQMNLTLIRKAPISYFEEVARSLSVYWFPAAGALASMHSRVLHWVWAAVHVSIMLAFFTQLIVFAGAAVFQASRRLSGMGGEEPTPCLEATREQILGYLIAGTIVFYTMILSCVVDIGEVRQRRPTDVLIVSMVFVGTRIWLQSLRSSALAASGRSKRGDSAGE
jgi:hypothetical protein